MTAGVGEFVLGVAAVVLAGRLHDSTPARLAGLGTGIAVGAAGGAYLIASQPKRDGLLSYQNGDLQIASPEVRIRPNLTTDRSPAVGVALVSVQW